MRITHTSAAGCLALLLSCGTMSAGELPARFAEELRELLPGASQSSPIRDGILEIRDEAGGTLGKLYLEQIEDEERRFGYAGTVEVAVVFDGHEKVAGVLIGRNAETRRYLNRIRRAKFLERWNGLAMSEIPDRKIDAVTGATYSSEAISHGVRRLAEAYLKSITDEEIAAETQTEIARLRQRITFLEKDVAEDAARNQPARKSDEVELRLIAAVQGSEAARKFADARDLSYIVRAPQPAAGAKKNLNAPPPAANARKRKPSATDTALAAYRQQPSQENLDALRAAILADYEFHLGLRTRDNLRALKEARDRLQLLTGEAEKPELKSDGNSGK